MDEDKNEPKVNIKSPDEIVIEGKTREPKVTISDLAEKAAAIKQEPKPKKRIGLWIMVTVLILLLVGGALAIGYLWGNNTVKPTEANNSTTSNENTTESENNKSEISADTKIVNDEAEVKELISQIYDALKNKVEKIGQLSKTYDNDAVYYKPEDMTATIALDNSYGLNYDNDDNFEKHKLTEEIDGIFNNLGFTSYVDTRLPFVIPGYINSNKQIVCSVIWGVTNPDSISCGKTNWISDSKKKLINELSKAMGEELNSVLIIADESNIANSSVAPYQNLGAQVSNAHGLFYRNSPDSEWKYFTSTQMIVSCEKYSEHPDTENIKKAFADQECLKDGSGATLKVSEL